LLLSAVLRPRAATLLMPAPGAVDRYLFARTALSSKPAARRTPLLCSTDGTD